MANVRKTSKKITDEYEVIAIIWRQMIRFCLVNRSEKKEVNKVENKETANALIVVEEERLIEMFQCWRQASGLHCTTFLRAN